MTIGPEKLTGAEFEAIANCSLTSWKRPRLVKRGRQALIYIVIAELYYLNEKKGRPLDFRTKYERLAQSKQFVLLPFYPSHTLDFDACSAVTECTTG